ncbi:MAG: ATP-binding protein [Treponema sp.]|nr:ATP-binding protein [Treponema sp.]
MIETFPGYIPRLLYVEKIRPYIGSHIIKVLTGQRRTGKSYILYQLVDEIRKDSKEANIVYINTELAEFKGLRGAEELYGFIKSKQKKGKAHYVFIDEIQEVDRFEEAVRSLFAEGVWDIYFTGSNSRLLSGELATYLGGRYIQFQIHPLGYREFLSFYRLSNTPEALKQYLYIGGMPYLSSLPGVSAGQGDHLAFEYLRNVYESILLRDVVARENIRNIRFLENLVSYLADNTGNVFSANNISKYLKSQRINMPVQTIISYLGALERSFFIHRLERTDIRGLKVFEIGEKYYFEDIGIRNLLAGIEGDHDMAKRVEHAVYLFLIQRGFTVHVGKLDRAEIDFVAEKQQTKLYVQACYRIDRDETLNREFGNLEMVKDHFPKYVVTLDEELPIVNRRGIRHVHLKDFLMKDW